MGSPDLHYMCEEGNYKLQELQCVGVEGQVPACDHAMSHVAQLQCMKQEEPMHWVTPEVESKALKAREKTSSLRQKVPRPDKCVPGEGCSVK